MLASTDVADALAWLRLARDKAAYELVGGAGWDRDPAPGLVPDSVIKELVPRHRYFEFARLVVVEARVWNEITGADRATDDEKRCCDCRHVKPADEFYKNRTARGGLASSCIECREARMARKKRQKERERQEAA